MHSIDPNVSVIPIYIYFDGTLTLEQEDMPWCNWASPISSLPES